MASFGGSGSTLSNSASLVSAASTLSGDSTNYDMAGMGMGMGVPSAMVTSPPQPLGDDFDDFGGFGDAPAAAPAPAVPLGDDFGDFGFDGEPAPGPSGPPTA